MSLPLVCPHLALIWSLPNSSSSKFLLHQSLWTKFGCFSEKKLFRLLSYFKKLPISLLKLRKLSWILKIFSNPSWTMQTNKLKLLFKFWKISNLYFLNSEQNFQLTSLESNNLFHGTSSHFLSSIDLTDSKAESIWLLNFSLTGRVTIEILKKFSRFFIKI